LVFLWPVRRGGERGSKGEDGMGRRGKNLESEGNLGKIVKKMGIHVIVEKESGEKKRKGKEQKKGN